MRRVEESAAWERLLLARRNPPVIEHELAHGTLIDLGRPCTIIGGKNGAGKSRVLRTIAGLPETKSIYIDLHYLCEQALIIYRSRADFDEMTEEYESQELAATTVADVERVVGRKYDSLDWYALEVEIADETAAQRFTWSDEAAPLLPYFRASYRGLDYAAMSMGMGELSVHILFWILEQYRDEKDLVLLLDEPDAFLPPVGVAGLLARVLRLCLSRQWRVIVSTHSEEMIALGVENAGFTLLRVAEDGETVAVHAVDDPTVSDPLLARPAVDVVLFCEDESARHLTHALLEVTDRNLSRVTSIVWGSGDGDLVSLLNHLPSPPGPAVRFGVVFDGDQRTKVAVKGSRSPVFLPTGDDPDTLMMSLAWHAQELALRLGADHGEVVAWIDAMEGSDAHDWVNDLGDKFGRIRTLEAMARLWVDLHPDAAAEFIADLRAALA